MYRGYIKLHRALLDWEWYKKPNMVFFFAHCLLRANHKEKNYKGIMVRSGEFISGRKVLSEETGLTEQQVRTCIKYLKSTNELTTTPTKGIDGKYTVFRLNNWIKYQDEESINQASTRGSTKGQPRANQGLTTNKNVKNEKNVNIEARELAFRESLNEFVSDYGKETVRAFFDYWTEPNKSGSKMLWETNKTWDLSRRMKRWANSSFNSPKVSNHTNTQGAPLKRLEMKDIAVNSDRDARLLEQMNNNQTKKGSE